MPLDKAIAAATDCQRGMRGEILVCRRGQGSERYRIPESLRDTGFDFADLGVEGVSRERHRMLDAGGSGIGSCSASGAGGMTGCMVQKFRQWEQQKAGH